MGKTQKKGFIPPMLATLVEDIPSAGQWVYEEKFDGYSVIVTKFNHQVILYSRRGINLNADYPPVVAVLSKIPHNFIIDGEIIHLDKRGKETFQGLHQYTFTHTGAVEYCALIYLSWMGPILQHFPC